MPARHIPVGEPAHDAERQAIRFLVDGLPSGYAVYSNAWIVDHGGTVYELDAVVLAPHGIYVVEVKSHRGEVTGNDNDWYVPEPVRSPLRLNRKTAQILASTLRRRSYDAGRAWVEHFVFLAQAVSLRVSGPASEGRVHLRQTILTAITDAAALTRRLGRQPPALDAHASQEIDRLLRGVDPRTQPVRRIREYRVATTLERTERYVEHLAEHALTGARRVIRVYSIPPLAEADDRRRVVERCRWEAQVLARVGSHRAILKADPPFEDEAGICLPLEHFEGVSLPTWIARHRKAHAAATGLPTLIGLWQRVAEGISHAHGQGVVHRLLRPEVVLVTDTADAGSLDVRITGFELAKQVQTGQTVNISTLGDDRVRVAAPEIIDAFSAADPLTDQFGLGVLLGHLLAGRPLFESTQELRRRNGVLTRVRGLNPFVSQTLDDAVHRMLALRPADRFATLDEAVAAVVRALRPGAIASPPATAASPDNLPEGFRVGQDYEILGRLGAGGLATVYAARHLVSGTTRALKVAREADGAEEALRGEHQVLDGLPGKDARGIVRVIDLTRCVGDRLTLVMERVRGLPLSRYLEQTESPDPLELRRYAEDLLSALQVLQTAGVVHKDIKPDNLIVGGEGLTLIDFSLACQAEDAILAGTALYRDPALDRWTHAADRYAATLCLFEMYAGRHAFGGAPPAPGEAPSGLEDDLDDAGLVAFFRRGLDPRPERRFPSVIAMRAEFLEALGVASPAEPAGPPPSPTSDEASAPLVTSSLPAGICARLRLMGVRTLGELVSLTESQIRTIPGLGKKKQHRILAVRAALLAKGVVPTTGAPSERHCLWPALVGDGADAHTLDLGPAVLDLLARHGYATVGALAEATRDEIGRVTGVGPARIGQIVRALEARAARADGEGPPASLDAVWSQASRPLRGHQARILEEHLGLRGPRRTQEDIAASLEMDRAQVSRAKRDGLEHLDRPALADVSEHLEVQLDIASGILRLEEAAGALLARWPSVAGVTAEGVVRLIALLSSARITVIDGLDDSGLSVVARPMFDEKTLRHFLRTARELAGWPPAEPEAVRRTLRPLLPEYDHDTLALVERLLGDVRLTDAAELFQTPVEAGPAIEHVLRRLHLPVTVAELKEAVERTFRGFAHFPEPDHLAEVLARIPDCHLEGERVVAGRGHGRAAGAREMDPLPAELLADDPPQVIAGRMLRHAAEGGGWRLVVTPPEAHLEIGRSVAAALGEGTRFVSVERELLERMEPRFAEYERAERFAAQRRRLTAEADAFFSELLARCGRPGERVVVGDTGILGLCNGYHLVRRLYDETRAGDRGFWALVIPGVIRRQQPQFNERVPVFHLPGATLPLLSPIPLSVSHGPGNA